ncbi:PspC domain-containing protein [Companilactobacillus metriopterae]|uniref:PspC domain-containing protein n=1 Tax=Companilactobacillus metriopterae TaxID=1909267 RepID=UPI00100B7282|nr:PspC domain-containing protein [Companilactobacillus metriopterae]
MHIPIKRSANNRLIAGVVGGICEKFGWSPALGRIVYLVLGSMSFFAGIPIYLVLWLLMEKPDY